MNTEKKIIISAFKLLFACSMISCDKAGKEEKSLALDTLSKEALVDRGKYLVTTIGCGDCHSPKIMGPNGPMEDPNLVLSGFPSKRAVPVPPRETLKKGFVVFNQDLTAAIGPWGTSFAANLTSDVTGVGSWSSDQFKIALKNGKYKGIESARPLMPPMPWQNFSNLTDQDVEAIFQYLKSVKAVSNVVPAYIPAASPSAN